MSESLRNLRRVVVAGPGAAAEGWPVRILAVEVYDDGFIVRFVTTGAAAGANPNDWFSEVAIRDDAGRAYRPGSLTAAGHGLLFAGPALRERAGWVELDWRGDSVRIALGGRGQPVDDSDDGPLSLIRWPLTWRFWEPTDLGLRILTPGGWSYDELSDVEVEETPERVVVRLYRRLLAGSYPGGEGAAENLAAKPRGRIEIRLAEAVGNRSVHDGNDGDPRPRARLNRAAPEGEDDWFAIRDESREGSPVWQW